MQNMIETATVTLSIRAILRAEYADRKAGVPPVHRLGAMINALNNLETAAPSRDPAAFEAPNLDAFGYATVLSYLNDEDPLTLAALADPVRDTIGLGVKATALCHARGLKVIKIPACEHVKARYAKVTHVNAYPVAVLAEVIFGSAA